ncbi:ATG16 family protein [Dactylosporangium matsuzakiense]|uniref:Uncharacterized protein n=1 Tax=Dactylosporangium matsuzakiense TaxID=53360 RepID=A0A9W6NRZ5_9ACTN|nr:ATG16 family protein [Dactylosporangium matsuzakiense]UWZ46519.1 hypothetical protein Dmats_08890 [Dactylosporangium matsuzakiense]GLL06657.1 hypothetical protein GCM10017581_084070 [Dactylosporangium matsuzakiense]
MTYPQGNPNDGYGFPDPNAPAGAYPPPPGQAPASGPPGYPATAPASPYGEQPQPQQYAQPQPGQPYPPAVPPQPQPTHDQGTSQLPAYGNEAAYSLDPSVSAPPTAALGQPAPPMSAPPMSGPPMSGPPMGYGPVSGPPTTGFPGAPIGYPGAEAPKKRGIAVPLLASLLALAVIAAGVFVGLYIDKSGKLDKSEKQSAQRQAALDQSNKDLEQTRKDLTAKADELTKAQQDLRGTQADSTEAKRQRDVIGTCLKLLVEASDAAGAGDKTTYQNKIAEANKPCNEAEVLLGF